MPNSAANVTEPHPASSPSRPSEKFTALLVAQTNAIANTSQTARPRSTPASHLVTEIEVHEPAAMWAQQNSAMSGTCSADLPFRLSPPLFRRLPTFRQS